MTHVSAQKMARRKPATRTLRRRISAKKPHLGLLSDQPRENPHEWIRKVAQRISIHLGNINGCWADCKEVKCRRRRRCFSPQFECSNAPSGLIASPEFVDAISDIQKLWRERMAAVSAGRSYTTTRNRRSCSSVRRMRISVV